MKYEIDFIGINKEGKDADEYVLDILMVMITNIILVYMMEEQMIME